MPLTAVEETIITRARKLAPNESLTYDVRHTPASSGNSLFGAMFDLYLAGRCQVVQRKTEAGFEYLPIGASQPYKPQVWRGEKSPHRAKRVTV
jgi:hypothetical protein